MDSQSIERARARTRLLAELEGHTPPEEWAHVSPQQRRGLVASLRAAQRAGDVERAEALDAELAMLAEPSSANAVADALIWSDEP